MGNVESVHPIIHVENLSLSFNSQVLFDRFCLTVHRGKKVLLSGCSGSGKSSLLKCLLGLLKPQSGTIWIDDVEMCGKTVWAIRKKIGYIAQESQLGNGRVRTVLQVPFSYHSNRDIQYAEEEVLNLCDRFLLGRDILDKDIMSVSGGEKQRIALISAILLNRPIYLLDEVTSALDVESRRAVLDTLRQMHGKTLIMVSHDETVHAIADQVVMISPAEKRPEAVI